MQIYIFLIYIQCRNVYSLRVFIQIPTIKIRNPETKRSFEPLVHTIPLQMIVVPSCMVQINQIC